MSKIQVLVTTMFEKDLSKYKQMNLQTDAIIANQSDDYNYLKEEIDGTVAELITTNTKGLSRNRNIAITCSSSDAEYLLFSDDDLVFYDDYERIILDEFAAHPEAQAIKFNLENKGIRKISMSPIKKFKKANIKNISSSGVCGLAVKRDVLLEKNLRFNEEFGAGTENYCGEDTIFLQELLKKKVKFYLSPKYIADIYQGESTWNEGKNQKYFTVTGRVLKYIFPVFCYLLAIRSSYRFSKRENCNMKFFEILKCYYKGMRK